jgi:hypothetical protein
MLPKLITNAQQYVSRDTKGLTIAEENLILCTRGRTTGLFITNEMLCH